jgi:hypothetical protein
MNSIGEILSDVKRELARAMEKHGPQQSAHESYALILEELDEFKAEVWKKEINRSEKAMREELVQIAATACRAIHDLELCAGAKQRKRIGFC